MAIWQFDLSFIPRDGPLPWRTGEGHEVPALTTSQAGKARTFLPLLFGTPRLMMEDWLVFGETNGNRIDLLSDPQGDSQLTLRISTQVDSEEFRAKICRLASDLGCIFFSAEFWVPIEPNEEMLAAALERSRATTFVRDPLTVFDSAGSAKQ